jgi:acyl-coenzyme A thioesterase PaaI-like protein
MDDVATLTAMLAGQPLPPCAALVPSEVIGADLERGCVKLRFAEQRAFENHFGNIAGGFAVGLIDVLVSVAAYAKTRQWCPTVDIHSRFVGQAKIGVCEGEAWVVKAGKSLVFLEANLWGADGQHAVHATAIVACRGG